MEDSIRCFAVVLVLPAAVTLLGAGSADSPVLPRWRPRYPVKITRRDGTPLFGDLTSIADGRVVVNTLKGTQTLGAEEIRSITPVDPLGPKRGGWKWRGMTEQAKREVKDRLPHMKRRFVEMFASHTTPRTTEALELMARISGISVLLGDREVPTQVIEEARDSSELNSGRSRRDLLMACEAIAYKALEDERKYQSALRELDPDMRNRLFELGVKWREKMERPGRRRGGRLRREASKGP